jgi:hypothetical protein
MPFWRTEDVCIVVRRRKIKEKIESEIMMKKIESETKMIKKIESETKMIIEFDDRM